MPSISASRPRRLTALLMVSAIAMSGGLTLAANPAMAADYTGYCNDGTSNPGLSISKAVGETYTWQDGSGAGSGCSISTSGTAGVVTWTSSNGGDSPSTDPTTLSQGATLTVTAATAGSQVLTLTGSTRTYTLTFTVGGGGGGGGGGSNPSPATSGTTSSPAPVVQQFGLPATGTCDEAAPAALNVAGVSSGGWGISWAQWMNDGAGGPVCTRTLGYVGSGWTVL